MKTFFSMERLVLTALSVGSLAFLIISWMNDGVYTLFGAVLWMTTLIAQVLLPISGADFHQPVLKGATPQASERSSSDPLSRIAS